MAKDRLVVQSIETGDGRRCVDIFRRQNNTFGFAEYIREPEDTSGWQPAGQTGGLQFQTENEALDKAIAYIPWMKDAIGDPHGR